MSNIPRPSRADVAVVGGSYAGLAAALQVARANRKVVVFDTDRPRNRFASVAHGAFGQDGENPFAMRTKAREQLLRYPKVSIIPVGVDGVEQRGASTFLVRSANGHELECAKLILAYGITDVLPAIPGLDAGWGQTILQCPYCHGYELTGRRLALLYTMEASLHQIRILPDWSDDIVFLANGHAIPDAAQAELARRGIPLERHRITSVERGDQGPVSIRFERGAALARMQCFSSPTRVRRAISPSDWGA